MNNKIQEIKHDLESITPHPWGWAQSNTNCSLGECVRNELWSENDSQVELTKEDYKFAAKSPANIAYLLSEYDRIQEENESLKQQIESVNQALQEGVPVGMKTAQEFLDWLYSTLPFLVEDGDKE